MNLAPHPSTFMVCSTYRAGPAPLRLYGVMHLVEEARNHNSSQQVSLAIIDSSPAPHPFFVHPEAFLAEHRILYLHMPSRVSDAAWRNRFSYASQFVPDDQTLQSPIWKERYTSMQAWDNFLMFTEEFRKVYKGPQASDFMHMERPAIGMKKNVGIAALTESFGAGDFIIFCDDDDRRHPDYIGQITKELEEYDFTRMRNWLTLKADPTGKDGPLFGLHDVPFKQDHNGLWFVPPEFRDNIFHSTLKNSDGSEFKRSIGSKFSVPLCMAWPPLGHEGALHNYRYDTWEKSVKAFGGCAPTSFCEDMLMYKFCEMHLDKFQVSQIENTKPLFLRCSDGSNASEVQWTENLPQDHSHQWAHQAAFEIQRELTSPLNNDALIAAGKSFLENGKIDWSLIFPSAPNYDAHSHVRPFPAP